MVVARVDPLSLRDLDRTLSVVEPAEIRPASLLLVLSSSGPIASIQLPAHGTVSIGRGSGCTIVVDDASLSRRHATLRLPELTIADHGSRNGTWIGGARAAGEREVAVPIGRPFRLGHVNAIVVRVGALDRSALRELDAMVARARREGSCVFVARGTAPVPGWVTVAGAEVLMSTDELWLAARRCTAGTADELARARAADREVGIARFPETGLDASELYLAAERDRGRRQQRAGMIDATYSLATRIAPSAVSVLIQGETGTGKEMLAELIHRRSTRADRPLVKVNCAAVAPTLFESQIFGHERGAFTGAFDTQIGMIEAADGGTLFLDEVAELPLEHQSKLLRVLEDRVVTRVGAVHGRHVDVRFITASNDQLTERVAMRAFRADLYFRLAGVTIAIPPLRERRDEIRALAELFALRAAELTRAEAPAISAAALAQLRGDPWPGNIRQLRNVIERAVLLCDGPTILPEHLLLVDPAAPRGRRADTADETLDDDNPQDVTEALARCAGNQTRAARLLGISRNTLLARLDRFGLPRPRRQGE